MIVRKGVESDYPAVVLYWNSLIGKDWSCFKFAPTTTVEAIGAFIQNGYSLYVAYEGDELVGFGMWKNETLLGCPSNTREIWHQLGKHWVEENLGKIGVMRYPNIVCNEVTWFDDMGVPLERTPESYKPLKPGEDISQRKVWTYKVTVPMDAVKRAIDNNFVMPN